MEVIRRSQPSTPPLSISEDRSLSRTAFELDSDAEFWARYLPRDDSRTVYVGGVTTIPWLKTLRDIAAFDNTTRVALNAVALTILGRSRSDPTILQESTRLYARALAGTNRALQDVGTAQSDAVLACCKILAM